MKLSSKFKITIFILLFIFSLVAPTNVFAAFTGAKSSNQSPVLVFDTIDKTKLTNVVLRISDGGSISKYEIYCKDSSGKYVTAPSSLYKVTKEADNKIKVTLLHSGMKGKKTAFKITATDNASSTLSATFALVPKTENNATYYAVDCYPRITDLKYDASSKNFSFKLTDNGASTTIKIVDKNANNATVLSTTSTSVSKTISINLSKLKASSGYYYLQLVATDKNGYVNSMHIKFSIPTTSSTTYNNSKTFKFTYYTKAENGTTTASGLTTSDFKIDPNLGCYTYGGKVVLAGATKACANALGLPIKSNIHYFTVKNKGGDTVQFTYNGRTYTGIVIDACGASCKVSSGNPDILDVFFPTKTAAEKSGINQKKLTVKY